MLTLEQQARIWRARIYGECSNANWLACMHKWLEPEQYRWLKENQ